MSGSAADRWATLQALLDDALERDAAGRAAVLAALPDPELRADLAGLLAAADAVPAFLDAPAPWGGPAPDDADLAGVRIGPYRLVREIGRGGQGRVFLADRDDVGTRVALKLVHGTLAGPDLVGRFLAERRVLGRLDHPHIARFLDAGSAETGVAGAETPYVVMEAVEGVPVTDYARGVPLAERLRLILQVCDAVAYAHRRLVVHRDLKPSNILVSGAGSGAQVKLLDFGIAKVLGDGDDGALTTTGHRLMTPEYAAPEQVLGQPVTVATDVYALGVLLYEPLAGARPYAIDGGLRQAVRAVCDEVPPPPSAVGGRALRGDLDTIAMKALAKAPDDRYATVDALAEDLRRYRDGRPVRARRQTARYHAVRFVRRHRAASVAGALGLLLLAAFGVRERQLRTAAEAARVEAQATADLLTDLFGATGVDEIRPDTLRAVALIDRAARRLRGQYADAPRLKAALTFRLGRLYEGVGQPTRGLAQYRAAEALARRAGDADGVLAQALTYVGYLETAAGHCERSLAALGEAVARSHGAAARADALAGRAAAYACLGRHPEAVADAQAAQRAAAGSPDDDGAFLHLLSDFLGRAGRHDEAVAALRAAVARGEAVYPRAHPAITARRNALSHLLAAGGDLAGAERVARASYDETRAVHAPTHARTLGAQIQLARVLRQARRLGAADTLTAEVVRTVETLSDTEVVVRNRAYRLRALVLLDLGRLAEAEAEARASVAVPYDSATTWLGDRVLQFRTLRDVLAAAGRPAEAARAERAAAAVEAEIAARRTAD
ncbi:protein kinase domain-containing protein [Rubrivirga sp. IMCC45206]|uniref:serine/threonine-protein kinase n=1 Tax=Rubrivirga sp. IMCC45206 TaxID=3391614 RepID=UPI0039900596